MSTNDGEYTRAIDNKAATFFRRICQQAVDTKSINVVMVSHLVDSAAPFLPVIAEYFTLRAVYAKRNSIDDDVQRYLKQRLPYTRFERLDRNRFAEDPAFFVSECLPEQAPSSADGVILVDIGGYFAEAVDGPNAIRDALERRRYRLLGIVEDTENGHKRYQEWLDNRPRDTKPLPIYSVARSPLKSPENHLVGVAITFSIEAILREQNIVLQSRRAGVIGFGPIGRSVASALRNRGIPVRVCEVDPIRLAIAAAQGFHVHHYDDDYISFVNDLNLIVSATGAGAQRKAVSRGDKDTSIDDIIRPSRLAASRRLPLNGDTVGYLEYGTYVASVTSSDDEIDLASVEQRYEAKTVSDNVTLYTERGPEGGVAERRGRHQFMMMMNGNAVNFAHGGVIGPAIELLQGEIVMCMQKLSEISSKTIANANLESIQELSTHDRRVVADKWLDQYLVENMQQS